ncbi:DUF6615 family protein [Devosia sp. XK-2]|uniref:DUF6615 family protein n=1 Tax=Devosia sp. XK-2 TaxID=3126689 RepID=UPI0030D3376A
MLRYPNWCRSFADESREVWSDMSDALRLGISRQEETTTENLLLSLARKHDGRGLKIQTFTRSEEASNGADWAFWFASKSRLGIELRVQAKRLFSHSGRYESLFHQSPSQQKAAKARGGETPNQCEALISNRGNAIPVYVFYNSNALSLTAGQVALAACSPLSVFVDEAVWGISVASAFAVRSADWGKKDRPHDFLNVPWHLLLCSCYWPDRSIDASLPALIGNGLRHLFGDHAFDDERDINFEPHENQPDWVGLLREREAARETLTDFMREANLKGVAVFSERPIDE